MVPARVPFTNFQNICELNYSGWCWWLSHNDTRGSSSVVNLGPFQERALPSIIFILGRVAGEKKQRLLLMDWRGVCASWRRTVQKKDWYGSSLSSAPLSATFILLFSHSLSGIPGLKKGRIELCLKQIKFYQTPFSHSQLSKSMQNGVARNL